MTEENFLISNFSHQSQESSDTLLRAVVPSHLHEFRDTRNREIELGHINYPIPIYNPDDTLKACIYFKFELIDWRFYWYGENSNSIDLSVSTLNRQFLEIRNSHHDLIGANYPFPLPTFTKIQITKTGRYYLQGGLIVGHTDRNLKVQTVDGIVSIRQQFSIILDPNETLPFGFPCLRTG